uniref:Uncharacterized protein n=1 Tax=Junco hyemalis TaxID=40217 RepID=A0A8C5IL36_JUNHY
VRNLGFGIFRVTTSKSHMGKLRHKVAGMDQWQIKNVGPRLCHEDGAAQRHSWFQMCLTGDAGRVQLWQGQPRGEAGGHAGCHPVTP